MIDISNLNYTVILILENGKQLDITDITEEAGWEESKGELAMRISVSLKNQKQNGTRISSLAKPGCIVCIFVKSGEGSAEVARGIISDWEQSASNSKESFRITCYDILYHLLQSQDYIYYAKGTGTKNAILKIFKDWNVPIGKYEGPNEIHGKMVYKSETIGDILLDILDEVVKKGSKKYIIQTVKGKVNIIPKGSNQNVYCFDGTNSSNVSSSLCTSKMVTRVKVLSRENGDKKQSVEEILDGKTEYGIRQKIYIKKDSDSRNDAKTAAKAILKEQGKPEKSMTLESPDVPYIRKGDRVRVRAGTLNGSYIVAGIRHTLSSRTMSMDLEPDENPQLEIKG